MTFAPHGTKAIASAIPPKLTHNASTRLRVPSYASRWITGGIPVGPYSVAPFGPPSEVHSPIAPCPASTVRDSLKVCSMGYFSPSQVCLCSVVVIICRARTFVKRNFYHTKALLHRIGSSDSVQQHISVYTRRKVPFSSRMGWNTGRSAYLSLGAWRA